MADVDTSASSAVDTEALAERRKADKERKAAEKAAKNAEKATRQAERQAAQARKTNGDVESEPTVVAPSVTLLDYQAHTFGNLFIQSHPSHNRKWTSVAELEPALCGQEIWVRARVATSRKQGKMLCFLQLRESIHTVQAVVYSKEGEIVPFAATLPRESVVDIFGEISVPNEPVASCSQSGVELQVRPCPSRPHCVRSVGQQNLYLRLTVWFPTNFPTILFCRSGRSSVSAAQPLSYLCNWRTLLALMSPWLQTPSCPAFIRTCA